jgi:hypothetical protein
VNQREIVNEQDVQGLLVKPWLCNFLSRSTKEFSIWIVLLDMISKWVSDAILKNHILEGQQAHEINFYLLT